MLTEEALILIATLAATGLLVLGVLDLVWPSARRVPERRARVTPRPVLAPTGTAPEPPLPPAEATPESANAIAPTPTVSCEPLVAPTPAIEPVADPARVRVDAMGSEPAEDVVTSAAAEAEAPSLRAGADAHAPAAMPIPLRRESRADVLPIETCVGMFRDGRYAEVVALGSAALVGRAKQHLGDRDGARAAYGAALRAALPSLRPTYVGHVVELASAAAGTVPGAEVAVDAGAGAEQVRELLASAASVDDALAIVPADASLERARAAVREALAIACERLVRDLGAGEGGHEARALVLQALADESMPAAWRERVGEQLTPISSAEIGQLTAQAIRCVQEGRDGDALEALERAERLFVALPAGTVPAERLEEFERRLWWGYTKLGLSCIETSRFEEALEPLLRALHLGGIDADRLRETRVALVGALEALVDDKARALNVCGAGGVAAVEIDKLSALLRSSVERGVRESDLADAFTKVQTLKQTRAHLGERLT